MGSWPQYAAKIANVSGRWPPGGDRTFTCQSYRRVVGAYAPVLFLIAYTVLRRWLDEAR